MDLTHALSVACSAARRWVRPEAVGAATSWLHRCLGVAPGELLPDVGFHDDSVDQVLDRAWRDLPADLRTRLGQVFTPRPVARQLLVEAGFPGAEAEGGHLLDPACGGGIFLLEAARMRGRVLAREGMDPRDIAAVVLGTTHGIDVSHEACQLARLFVGLEVVSLLRRAPASVYAGLPTPSVVCADALESETRDAFLATRRRPRWLVGNPPYLEAKRMPAEQRQRLRARFPGGLRGAFDLYVAFLRLGMELMDREGCLALVLPNKFQVARYGEALRAELLEGGLLRCIVDLSELEVFRKVSVYPILLVLSPGGRSFRAVWSVHPRRRLGSARLPAAELPYSLLEQLADPPVFLTLPEGPLPGLLERLLRIHPRLADQVEIRSTCSFHRKGLRERYVRPAADLDGGLDYLGGRSYARSNEVRPFAIRWAGYRIDRRAWELSRSGNPLPPLEIFQRPKVVYCQHARSLVAAWDPVGRYVTKDVYPVALPRDGRAETAAALTALFNSMAFSALYSLFFRGIQVGGRYLHFLPVYLRRMPLPELGPERISRLAELTRAIGAEGSPELQARLDEEVFDLYGATDGDRAVLVDYAEERLGFSAPPLERR